MNLISPIVNRWIQDGKDNPDALWERAADELHWFRTWDKVFEWNYPSFRWFSGRADEIIKIAGHRIGTIEVETALLKHPAVAESGVIGRPDEIRGEVISAFVLLKMGCSPSPELKKELLDTVRHDLGPVAVIGEVNFVSMLPKMRSGKIMRRE